MNRYVSPPHLNDSRQGVVDSVAAARSFVAEAAEPLPDDPNVIAAVDGINNALEPFRHLGGMLVWYLTNDGEKPGKLMWCTGYLPEQGFTGTIVPHYSDVERPSIVAFIDSDLQL